MLVIALCTACFFRAKINKKTLPPYFLIWLPYFECSDAGTERHNINLRNKNNLFVPTCKKTLSENRYCSLALNQLLEVVVAISLPG